MSSLPSRPEKAQHETDIHEGASDNEVGLKSGLSADDACPFLIDLSVTTTQNRKLIRSNPSSVIPENRLAYEGTRGPPPHQHRPHQLYHSLSSAPCSPITPRTTSAPAMMIALRFPIVPGAYHPLEISSLENAVRLHLTVLLSCSYLCLQPVKHVSAADEAVSTSLTVAPGSRPISRFKDVVHVASGSPRAPRARPVNNATARCKPHMCHI